MNNLTLRGRVTAAQVNKITLFDGAFDTGYILKRFIIAPQDVNDAEKIQSKLTTIDHAHQTSWFWDRNTEIAWATWNTPTNSRSNQFELIDQGALIIEDLFIDTTADTGEEINYYIELEKVKISDWQGALAMVRNQAQGY